MAIINAPANGGFFQSAGQAFTQGADRATEVLMQERELDIAKQQQKLQEKQFELQNAQAQAEGQRDLQRIAIQQQAANTAERVGAAQTTLISAEAAGKQLENQAAPSRFAAQQGLVEAQTALATANASAVPRDIGVAEGNLALNERMFNHTVAAEANKIAIQEQTNILSTASSLGVSPLEIARLVNGSPDLSIEGLQGLHSERIRMSKAGNEEEAKAERFETKLNQLVTGLSFTNEQQNSFMDTARTSSSEELLQSVLTEEGIADEDKAKLLLAVQLLYPDISVMDKVPPAQRGPFMRFINFFLLSDKPLGGSGNPTSNFPIG